MKILIESVSVAQAARHFDVVPETVRRWIRAGAPCVSPGEVGRGRGARLNIDDLACWRASRAGINPHADILAKVEAAIGDVLRRDGGHGRPIAEELGISTQKAATLLTHVHSRIERALRGVG